MTTQSAERRTDEAREAVDDARSSFADTLDTVRSTAGSVGERVPDMIETVRSSASEGARTVQSWPVSTQRLAAAFSLGLGVGLTLAGAPRLVVVGALAPALVVAASFVGREQPEAK